MTVIANQRGTRPWRGALVGSALLLATSCGQTPQKPVSESGEAPVVATAPARSTSIPALTNEASLCGRSLGIAVRCNMVNDQNDFAILRYLALKGLEGRAPGDPNFAQVENAFDLAALESINSVGSCQGATAGMSTLQQKIQNTIAQCAGSQQ